MTLLTRYSNSTCRARTGRHLDPMSPCLPRRIFPLKSSGSLSYHRRSLLCGAGSENYVWPVGAMEWGQTPYHLQKFLRGVNLGAYAWDSLN